MSRSKKMFAWATLVFLGLLFYATYDIARRTTFPGKKPHLKTKIEDVFESGDTLNTQEIRVDSIPRD
jgi:hypothetical protein